MVPSESSSEMTEREERVRLIDGTVREKEKKELEKERGMSFLFRQKRKKRRVFVRGRMVHACTTTTKCTPSPLSLNFCSKRKNEAKKIL